MKGGHLAAFGVDGVVDGAKAQLLGAEVFGVAADRVLDHVTWKAEIAGGGNATDRHVNMRMAGVEVGYGESAS